LHLEDKRSHVSFTQLGVAVKVEEGEDIQGRWHLNLKTLRERDPFGGMPPSKGWKRVAARAPVNQLVVCEAHQHHGDGWNGGNSALCPLHQESPRQYFLPLAGEKSALCCAVGTSFLCG
jgi:hypothetical protein